MSAPTPEKKYWLDDSRNVDRLFWALCGICGLLLVGDFLFDKHGHFDFENFPVFYAAFGFGAYMGLVLLATQLRKLLKRDEDYYD